MVGNLLIVQAILSRDFIGILLEGEYKGMRTVLNIMLTDSVFHHNTLRKHTNRGSKATKAIITECAS